MGYRTKHYPLGNISFRFEDKRKVQKAGDDSLKIWIQELE